MDLKSILLETSEEPLGETLPKVGPLLFKTDFLIPIAELPESEADEEGISLLTSIDKDGQTWFYLYTDEEELSNTFEEGAHFIEINFADIFGVALGGENIGGLAINGTFYLPKEAFEELSSFGPEDSE